MWRESGEKEIEKIRTSSYFHPDCFVEPQRRARKSATPAIVQTSAFVVVGTSTYMTKFVEWPVVDNVPFRLRTLYSGHLYTF